MRQRVNSIIYQIVKPYSKKWSIYLDQCYDYLLESWPELLQNTTKINFLADYEKDLLKRYSEGKRGFLLFFQKEKIVGLANAYILDDILFIAEFYVLPKFRKKGIGSTMKDHIVNWGRGFGAKNIHIEVDNNLEVSNLFWFHFFTCIKKGNRNLYSGLIE